MTILIEVKKMEAISDFNRNRVLTTIFLITVFVIFLVGCIIHYQEDKLRLIAVVADKTLVVSVAPIFFFSLYCRSVYFWKFLALYSFFGFIFLFFANFAYSRGEFPALSILKLTSRDYWDYIKFCSILIIFVSIPVRLISDKTG